MKLLYLAVAYLAGLGAGQLLWQQGWFGCGIDDYLWISALALIPGCLWMDVRDVPRGSEPMVWPTSAGFVRPRTSPSIWLIGGVVLAGMCGVLRLGIAPAPTLPSGHPTWLTTTVVTGTVGVRW